MITQHIPNTLQPFENPGKRHSVMLLFSKSAAGELVGVHYEKPPRCLPCSLLTPPLLTGEVGAARLRVAWLLLHSRRHPRLG
jgi:hypothetical protein